MTSTRYDPEADAAYIKLSGASVFESEEVAPDIILDFDREGRVTGIEVLNASMRLAPGDWSQAPLPGDPRVEAAE